MKRLIALALTASAGWLSAGAAVASDVYWSVGISAPVVGAVVSNAPPHRHGGYGYYPAPVYGPSVVYAPPPVYVAPRPIYYAPVVVQPRRGHRHRGWDRDRGPRHSGYHDHGRRGRGR